MKIRFPRLYWAISEPDVAVLDLFESKADLEQTFPGKPAEADWYVDDGGYAFESRMFPSRTNSKWLILGVLVPRLYCITGRHFQEAIEHCSNRPDIYLYVEDPIKDELGKYVVKTLETPSMSLRGMDSRCDEWPSSVKRVLELLSIIESCAMKPAPGLTAINSPSGTEIYATAGWQAGLKYSVESYRLYWLRFLDWCRAQHELDGMKCAIDLGYVSMLQPISSMAGFILAAGSPQVSETSPVSS